MKYFFNAYDIKKDFGIDITNSVNPLLQMPDRKTSITNDMEDENGQDIDLMSPKFSSRSFPFNCTLTADTIEDFKNKYFGLFQLLKIAGVYSVYNDFLDMTVFLFFQKQTNISNMYRTSNSGYGITFVLNFGEGNPFDNIPLVALIDDVGSILIP